MPLKKNQAEEGVSPLTEHYKLSEFDGRFFKKEDEEALLPKEKTFKQRISHKLPHLPSLLRGYRRLEQVVPDDKDTAKLLDNEENPAPNAWLIEALPDKKQKKKGIGEEERLLSFH